MQLKRGLLIIFAAVFALFAQGERGTFNGTVTDPSGAAVAGAKVQMVNPATGLEFNTVTNDAGIYRMPSLPSGTYRITVTSPGFKSALRDNVVLSVAQTLTLDFVLEVGNISDSVTVSSEAPLIETGTAEIGSDPAQIRPLWTWAYRVWHPLMWRDPNLVLLAVAVKEVEYWVAASTLPTRLFRSIQASLTHRSRGNATHGTLVVDTPHAQVP